MKGISNLISFVIIIVFIITILGIILAFGLPILKEAMEITIINEAKNNMFFFDNLIKQVSVEGVGSLKILKLKSNDGYYIINENLNSINFEYELEKYPIINYTKNGNLEIIINNFNGKIKLEMILKYDKIIITGNDKFNKGFNNICIKNSEKNNSHVILEIVGC